MKCNIHSASLLYEGNNGMHRSHAVHLVCSDRARLSPCNRSSFLGAVNLNFLVRSYRPAGAAVALATFFTAGTAP